jgi:DNA-binding response OmpR family regulator
MKIHVHVVSNQPVDCTSLAEELRHPQMPELVYGTKVRWQITAHCRSLQAEDLVGPIDEPSALVLTGQTPTELLEIPGLAANVANLLQAAPTAWGQRPVLLALPSGMRQDWLGEMPAWVSDWVSPPVKQREIGLRIWTLLKRGGSDHWRRHYGGLSLTPAKRQVFYGSQNALLTQTELMLLEFFLKKKGEIVRSEELLDFFRDCGKSAEANNLRVAIFQLRLKLAIISRSHVTVSNVHRKGYCLQEKTGRV